MEFDKQALDRWITCEPEKLCDCARQQFEAEIESLRMKDA